MMNTRIAGLPRRGSFLAGVALGIVGLAVTSPATDATYRAATWVERPLSMADALNLALQQNGTILKAKSDLEAAYGLVTQTRAIVMPKASISGNYQKVQDSSIEVSSTGFTLGTDQSWETKIRLVQSLYEGGRMTSALRSAKLTKEQALLQYQTVVADTLLGVRTAYYDILLAEQQILVREASVKLLQQELDDQQRRYDAGTVPRFNVLRAEVAVANARPQLIRARNAHRIAKNNLVNLLGYALPPEILEEVPLRLTDRLNVAAYQVKLPAAIAQAFEHRTELGVLRKAEALRQEGVVNARAGYLPSLQGFAGYGARKSSFDADLSAEVHGWFVGAQVNWDIFDGLLTQGKVAQAKAEHQKAKTDFDDTMRRIELEVRTAYSDFIQAREVLESQKKVQEEADEALRLARARADAGTGTQLDVLNAETALTEARTTQIEAEYGYSVSVAKFERAIGAVEYTGKR